MDLKRDSEWWKLLSHENKFDKNKVDEKQISEDVENCEFIIFNCLLSSKSCCYN